MQGARGGRVLPAGWEETGDHWHRQRGTRAAWRPHCPAQAGRWGSGCVFVPSELSLASGTGEKEGGEEAVGPRGGEGEGWGELGRVLLGRGQGVFGS